jgi:hypothetical protein
MSEKRVLRNPTKRLYEMTVESYVMRARIICTFHNILLE